MQRIVIIFFYVFLTSRFFSETIGVVPKFVDLLDLAFIPALVVAALLFNRPCVDRRENGHILKLCILFIFFSMVSAAVNVQDLLMPAALLFIVGFLEGPLLFVGLGRTLGNRPGFELKVERMLVILFYANLAAVALINFPRFLRSRNPDEISGTFGLNAYFFSVFLVICAGFFLGRNFNKRSGLTRIVLIQGFIIITFYLLQYRAALPFFIASYVVVLLTLYGRRILRSLIVVGFVGLVSMVGIQRITARTEATLKFDDWIDIASNPMEYIRFGKFVAYKQAALLMMDRPLVALLGVGPGNFLSRAYYTFSYELATNRGKGVGNFVEKYFNLSQPRFTEVSEYYLMPTRTGVVFGSHQLSNANSSYLAPIAEIGLIGGGAMIALYLYLLRRTILLLRLAKRYNPDLLPLTAGLVSSAVYLFGLGFLDNVWEMSRATLPIWLLFWTVNHALRRSVLEQERAQTAIASEGGSDRETAAPIAAPLPARP